MNRRLLIALVAGSATLCVIAAAIPLQSAQTIRPVTSAVIVAVTLASLLGVGLYAWGRASTERFGQILFLTGLCWFVSSFSNADGQLLYSLGRIFGWLFELMLIYALLAFPSGRIQDRAGRATVIAAGTLVCLGYLSTIPFVDQYPLPSPFGDCGQQCPPNFFAVTAEPDLIGRLVEPLRETLALAVYVAVATVLTARLLRAGKNLRRTEAPVLGAAVLRFLAAGAYGVLLQTDGASEDATSAIDIIGMLGVPVIAAGFLVGLLQWRVYVGSSLLRLTAGINDARDTADLRALAADCLDDPSVELYYSEARPSESGPIWRDSAGQACGEPVEERGSLLVVKVQPDGSRLAVRCEDGLGAYPRFVGAVCSSLAAGLERQRLDRARAALLRDVAASRKRLVSTADNARKKIERDLHDGAQQRLVALRVKLELAREALAEDPAAGSEVVARFGPEVDEIIEEVRALAHGIYPPLLVSGGLAEALRGAALHSPLPVAVEAEEVGRLPSEIESAVYFCGMEALQNVAKHAAGASQVTIRLWRDDEIRIEVRDDGSGFETGSASTGSGITGMRDRLEAQGGWLRVDSEVGRGTCVTGCVPDEEGVESGRSAPPPIQV